MTLVEPTLCRGDHSWLVPCDACDDEFISMHEEAVNNAFPSLEYAHEPPPPSPVPYWRCVYPPWRIVTQVLVRPRPAPEQLTLI